MSDPNEKRPIRTIKTPPNYATRQVQYRLFVLVGTLLTVFFMMGEAAKPKNWVWMWKLGNQPLPEVVDDAADANAIDASLPAEHGQAEARSFPPDSFVSRPPAEVLAAPENGANQVNYELLKVIQDNTYFRSEESEAWFHLFAILQNADEEDLEKEAISKVGFAQLFRQTDGYRGKLVQISGTVRRAFRVPAPANELNIDGYWQCFVRPTGANVPFVIYALDLPPEFPSGMDLFEPISVTGFCFKRWAYQAQGGPMVAPVILAKTATWTPEPPVVRQPVPEIKLAQTFAIAAFAGIVICGLVYLASVYKPARITAQDRQNVDQFSRDIADRSLPGVLDELRQIEKNAKG